MIIIFPGVILQVLDNTLAVILLLVLLNIEIVHIFWKKNIETIVFMLFYCLAFKYFGFDRSVRRFFQKRAMCTEFDIQVFIERLVSYSLYCWVQIIPFANSLVYYLTLKVITSFPFCRTTIIVDFWKCRSVKSSYCCRCICLYYTRIYNSNIVMTFLKLIYHENHQYLRIYMTNGYYIY